MHGFKADVVLGFKFKEFTEFHEKEAKMEYASSSANFSVDQDRCIVNKFAEKAIEEDIYIVSGCFYNSTGRG